MDWWGLVREVTVLGVSAYLGLLFGLRQNEISEERKTNEEVRTVLSTVDYELERIDQLLGKMLCSVHAGGLVYELFLPINSLKGNIILLNSNCSPSDVVKVRDAYVLFEEHDRKMIGALGSSSVFSDIYKGLVIEYWKNVRSPDTKTVLREAREALERLKVEKKVTEN